MKQVVTILLAIICISSSCRKPEKKLQRLLKKHPELAVTKYHTIKVPVSIKGFRRDTVFTISKTFKNVSINGKIKIRYDESGTIVPDSFIENKACASVKVLVDSSGINISCTCIESKLANQTFNIGKNGTKAEIDVNDSSINVNLSQDDYENDLDVQVPVQEINVEDKSDRWSLILIVSNCILLILLLFWKR